jgi:hypothetical protein
MPLGCLHDFVRDRRNFSQLNLLKPVEEGFGVDI